MEGLVFTGGSALAPALVIACIGPRRLLIYRLAVAPIVIVAFAQLNSFAGHPNNFGRAVQLIILGLLSLLVLMRAVTDAKVSRSPQTIWLALWIVGVFVFGAFVNWTTNARSFLPLVPPAAIIAARAIEGLPARRLAFQIAISLAAAVSMTVALADYQLARSYRVAADIIRKRAGGQRIWFTGHWGFQWYMESFAQPVDSKTTHMKPGDLLVMNLKTSNPSSLPAAAVELVDDISVPALGFASTHSRQVGGGFYSSGFGPLPFAFGRVPPERFLVYRVHAPIRPATTSAAAQSGSAGPRG
jgi:hypothetical protein